MGVSSTQAIPHLTFLSSLINRQLTFSSIMEEIPIRIRTNPLLGAFINTLTTPSPSSPPAAFAALPPSFAPLDLSPQSTTTNLSTVLEALDEYKSEEGTLAFLMRNIARDRNRANEHIQKRKDENALRVSQGLAPLPEEDISRLFRIQPEPSRLKSMLLLGQIDAYSTSLATSASEGLVKMYGANAGNGA